jgi:HAD superfamily hydrolase (TIGR01549 family)
MPATTQPTFLFDLDGTLVDTVYDHVLAWSAAFESVHIPVPRWKIHRRIGMSGRSLVKQLLREPEAQRRKVDPEKLESKHDAVFNQLSRRIRVLPGAQTLLDRLTRLRMKWAIATTGNEKQTRKLLQNLRLPKNAIVVNGDEVAQAKPSPDVFLLAAQRLEVSMEDCVVVGDAIWDMLAAARKRALGVGLLTGGYSKEELEESGAFRVYADPNDLLLHLEDLGLREA